MVFWAVVALIVLVVLGLAVRADRRRRGRLVNLDQPDAARGYTAARDQHQRTRSSDWNNMG